MDYLHRDGETGRRRHRARPGRDGEGLSDMIGSEPEPAESPRNLGPRLGLTGNAPGRMNVAAPHRNGSSGRRDS